MAPRRKVSVRGEEKQQPERMITRSALKKRLGSSGGVNNQQPRQPERKIQKRKKKSFKDDDKKKSKLAKDKPDKKKSNLAKDKPRKEKLRRFTYQERAEYKKRVKQSQGFDVGHVPSNIQDEDLLIRPLLILHLLPHPGAVEILKELEDLCKLAIKKYNKDNNTKYKFAKFLKANYCGVYYADYFITFQTKKNAGSCPENFQACVSTGDEVEVELCRPERKY